MYKLISKDEEKLIAYLDEHQNELYEALCTVMYSFGNREMTLDTAFASVRNYFYYTLTSSEYMLSEDYGIAIWKLYQNMPNLREFMVEISDVLMAFYNQQNISTSAVSSILSGFRALDASEQDIFCRFCTQIYYATLQTYFSNQGVNTNAIQALLQVEISYVGYMANPNNNSFKSDFEKAKSLCRGETDTLFVEFYEYYLEKYNSLFGN